MSISEPTAPDVSTAAPGGHSDASPVLVLGATGYIGRRLVTELVGGGHRVRAVVRNPAKLDAEEWSGAVEVVRGDVLDPASLATAFTGARAAYYLVHSIGGEGDWEERDRRAAANVRDAADAGGAEQLDLPGRAGRRRRCRALAPPPQPPRGRPASWRRVRCRAPSSGPRW